MARKKVDVTVVAPGEAGVFDGVAYTTTDHIPDLLAQKWDFIISSRAIEILSYPWQCGARVLWSHDMPDGRPHDIHANKVVFLSEVHKAHWQVAQNFSHIIGDGVDLSLFTGPELARNENVLVWTSNPDRGMATAAKIFHNEILPRWPDMELHFFGRSSVYGWPPEMEGPFLPRMQHMDHVFIHEPLTKAGLAKMLREAWALFYPTYWPETYCIATLEAQAAGLPVIASPFGALTETVKGGILTYDFVNAISQLRNKNRWEKLSKAGKEYAAGCDWDTRADQWLTLYESLIREVSNVVTPA